MTPREVPPSIFGTGVALPQWARVLIAVGVLPGIAIALIWLIAVRLTATVDAVKESMQTHQAQAQQIEHKVDEELLNHKISNSLLRQICVSLAKTSTDRRECAQ